MVVLPGQSRAVVAGAAASHGRSDRDRRQKRCGGRCRQQRGAGRRRAREGEGRRCRARRSRHAGGADDHPASGSVQRCVRSGAWRHGAQARGTSRRPDRAGSGTTSTSWPNAWRHRQRRSSGQGGSAHDGRQQATVARPRARTAPHATDARTVTALSSATEQALRAATFYQSAEAWRQLKLIAFEQGTSQQAPLGEALNALFARYGWPPVAMGFSEPPAQ